MPPKLIVPEYKPPQPVKPDAEAEVCGNCRFGHPIPETKEAVECRGVPPTPVMVGVGQDLAGRPQMGVNLLRARLLLAEVGCALFRKRQVA